MKSIRTIIGLKLMRLAHFVLPPGRVKEEYRHLLNDWNDRTEREMIERGYHPG